MKNLGVRIDMQKNSAALLTQRLLKQDLIEYFSKLAGSILGILGAVGFIMNLFERNYEKVERIKARQHTLNEIIDSRGMLYNRNFLDLAENQQQEVVEIHIAEPSAPMGSPISDRVRANYILPYDDSSASQSLNFSENLLVPNSSSPEGMPLYKF